jgi:predicted membrane protein
MLTDIWNRIKGWILYLLAAIVFFVDPKHVDNIAANHPHWAGLILAVWGLITHWVNGMKGKQPKTQP